MAYKVEMPQSYINEMDAIKRDIESYPGYKTIASSLAKFVPQNIVAGLIGCIIPESGTNHKILNAKEYNGGGASGTNGWNCGEGLVQWTFWKYKIGLIKKYNADSRSTQKLPTTWSEYSKGTPVSSGKSLCGNTDGKHISGLSLDDQMLFLTIYYADLINSLKDEENIAVITAKIYQRKAGSGFYQKISDPIERAYTTSKNKYNCSAGNHYLMSVKIAQQYINSPISASSEDAPVEEYVDTTTSTSSTSSSSTTSTSTAYTDVGGATNNVEYLASAIRRKNTVTQQDSGRKADFETLRKSMVDNAPPLGRDILLSEELYDSNILKGSQESKKDNTL